MTVKYNNLPVGDAKNLITFTDIPNIVSVEESQSGTCTIYQLNFKGEWTSTLTTPWYIKIDDTIRSVSSYADALNKNFLYKTSGNDNKVTAMTVANALRNCPNVLSSWRIEYTGGTDVYLYNREIGQNLFENFETNMPSSIFECNVIQQGSGTSGIKNKIGVDLYLGNDYQTTLTKYFYNGYCGFDVSPVLATYAEEGKSKPYSLKVWKTDENGNYTPLNTISTNYISQGYMVNLGNKYLQLGNKLLIAQNMHRGTTKSQDNESDLYVYGNSILMSVYRLTSGQETFTITYKNSAFDNIHSEQVVKTIDVTNSKLVDLTFNLNEEYFAQASYVDIYVNSTYETIRYGVIKPKKATEYNQRVCWRNSYGGISFFDFTGSRTETKNLEVTTYNKNIYDYYTSQMDELEKIYNSQVNYSVSIKSHIVTKDGSYIFNDLMQSPMIWTYVDGAQQAIILEDVAINEIDSNDIYEATIRYHYSMPMSII